MTNRYGDTDTYQANNDSRKPMDLDESSSGSEQNALGYKKPRGPMISHLVLVAYQGAQDVGALLELDTGLLL